jgi:hypothetical protein
MREREAKECRFRINTYTITITTRRTTIIIIMLLLFLEAF